MFTQSDQEIRRPARTAHYISPTQLATWEHCQEKYFLKYLSGNIIEEDQGIPAAMGCAFDSFVKRYCAVKLGFGHEPKAQIENLLNTVTIKGDIKDEIIRAGRNCAEFYIKLGLADRLLDEGLADVELEVWLDLPNGVRILGKPDTVIKNKSAYPMTPHDFKVRGYKSKSNYSPTPGYRMYITTDGKQKGAHNLCGVPLEQVNERWAAQMAIYWWALNLYKDTSYFDNIIEIPVAIDEVIYTSNGIVFSQIRTTISEEFQRKVYQSLHTMWNTSHNPEPASPAHFKCMAYNMLCGCAPFCKAYKQFLSLQNKLPV